MRRALIGVLILGGLGLAAGLWLTRAQALTEGDLAGLTGDAAQGETVFYAGGCASCDAAKDAEGEARLILSGGIGFVSGFGTFRAPNISMDPDQGIGAWTFAQFASAVQRGVSPEGTHYYPVFPYSAYALAEPQDIADLWAFWQTLPASDTENLPHEVGFPFSIRRGVGLWKLLYMPDGFTMPADTEPLIRGRYLVEALGHCAECHTPRDALGGLDRSRWMAGAPNPSGLGRIPGITPATLDWSETEITQFLADGFTPEFDVAAGQMALAILNLAQLPDSDRAAIAAYLKTLPAAEEQSAEPG